MQHLCCVHAAASLQLRRLDKPWEDFNHDLLVQAHLEARAIAAAEKERLEKEAKKAAKKGRYLLPPRAYGNNRELHASAARGFGLGSVKV